MILPTKHLSVENCLLGVGALILANLERPMTLSALWEDLRSLPEISTYERFILGLDLLYMIEVIEIREGKLRRLHQ